MSRQWGPLYRFIDCHRRLLIFCHCNNSNSSGQSRYRGVKEVLKGNPTIKEFEIHFFPDFPILGAGPEFQIDQLAVFFINSWKVQNVVVQDYGGKVIIEGEDVSLPPYIRDQLPKQKLQSFTNKIKKLSEVKELKIISQEVKTDTDG